MALISFTDKGLYCAAGDFFIDPWKPVRRALITHGHSDHARFGSEHYLCHAATVSILMLRLGSDISIEKIDWNSPVFINGVRISFHPAGHVIGSSQIRLEYKGEVWVVSGDYKTENDGISGAFEPIACHNFVTESTFGLPIYNWKKQDQLFAEIQDWILNNQANNRNAVLLAYSLGKAQRVIEAAAKVTDNIWAHGAVYNMQQSLIDAGHPLTPVKRITVETDKAALKNATIVAPSSADGTPWMRRFNPYRLGICSGWMQVRGNVRRNNADKGFVMSDHADWQGLLSAIKATGASKVFVTHGFQAQFSKYLNDNGIWSKEVKTSYGEEDEGEIEKTGEQ